MDFYPVALSWATQPLSTEPLILVLQSLKDCGKESLQLLVSVVHWVDTKWEDSERRAGRGQKSELAEL